MIHLFCLTKKTDIQSFPKTQYVPLESKFWNLTTPAIQAFTDDIFFREKALIVRHKSCVTTIVLGCNTKNTGLILLGYFRKCRIGPVRVGSGNVDKQLLDFLLADLGVTFTKLCNVG